MRYHLQPTPFRLGNSRRTALWLSVLCALGSHTAIAQTYRHIADIGTGGTTATGKLNYPNGVHVEPVARNIFVTDAGNNRVVEYSPTGAFVRAFGSSGTGNGQLNYPAGITVDPGTHNVFVADYYNDRVEVFSSSGAYLSQFAVGATACGVGIETDSRIIVSTGYGATVKIYTPGEQFSTQFGNSTNFGYPCGLAIAGNGEIIVADETKTNVQLFSSAGAAISHFGSSGHGNGQFAAPSPGGLAIDPFTQNFVVSDYGNNRVQVFASNGTYISQFGSSGTGAGQFTGPTDLTIDPVTHNLLVVDRGNNRVQMFTSCGPTLVSLSVLPQTQAQSQSILFSGSIGNVVSPSGLISMYAEDGTLLCTASTYGDPQAACSGLMTLGSHTVTAVWSGDNSSPSGCSDPVAVNVVTDLTTATNLTLSAPGNGNQGQPLTLTANASNGPVATPIRHTSPQLTGFVTFHDGSSVIAQVPLTGSSASFTNSFVAGTHSFSAAYSGDGNYATSNGTASVGVTKPSDDIFYGGLEVPPGN